MSNYSFIFPGQGAQVPKMGLDFIEKYAEAREVFEEAEEILKMHLKKLVFEGTLEELTLTKNCQPAIFVTSMAILRVVLKEFPDIEPKMTGGLSLGEYSALALSKKTSFLDLVKLVQLRGEFMHEASLLHPGAMAVVMGLEEDKIREAGYYVANLNCPGQLVIAGTISEIERSLEDLKNLGAKRVVKIPVSGAFHSPLMKDAEEKLRPFIEAMEFKESKIQLAMNVVGCFVDDVAEIKKHLIAQVSSMTKWLDCVMAMEEKGASCYLEIGPSQLSGMNKKIGVKAPTIAVQKIEDLESIYEASRR